MPALRAVKRFLPRTLLGRTLLILVTPLILLQAIAAWIFYDRHWDIVSRRLAGAVAGDIALTIRLMQDRPDGRAELLAAVAAATGLRAALREGDALPADEPPGAGGVLERRLRQALEARLGRPFRLDDRGLRRQIRIEVQLPDGVLAVLVPIERLFTATTYFFLVWMVGSSLVLLLVAGLFMRNQVRPIRRLAAAVDAFGKGRAAGDFHAAGAAEVRQAAVAFERMRDRIRRQIAQRTEMLAGVSHDLRTPLTRMKLALALLGDDPAVRGLQQDVVEMERMLEGYLAFARGEGSEAARTVDLAALLDEVAAGARRDGADLILDRPDRLLLPLRPDAMKRCLDNIVANAVRYGRRVRIAARRAGDAVEIVVDDDGPGIPPAERENVFRPFYRIEASRNPATGGVGLGLSIARDVARGHGGEITLANSPQGGLRVVVRLPV